MSTCTRSHPEAAAHLTTCRWEVAHARWSCARPGHRRSRDEAPERRALHAVLVAESRRVRDAYAAGRPEDPARLRTLVELVEHHLREDERLVALLGAGPAAAFDDSGDLTMELAAVARTQQAWVAAPTERSRTALADHLAHLHDLLGEHLGPAHERRVAQTARGCDPRAWASFRARSAAALPGCDEASAVLAWEDDPVVLDDLLAIAPRTPEAVVPLVRARALAAGRLSRSRTRPGSR